MKTWGSGGHDPGQLAYPWGVAVDKDDRVVAVDAGNNRLQVFEFLDRHDTTASPGSSPDHARSTLTARLQARSGCSPLLRGLPHPAAGHALAQRARRRCGKWVAIGMRLAVLLLFVLIIGGARWQRTEQGPGGHRPARHQRIDRAGPQLPAEQDAPGVDRRLAPRARRTTRAGQAELDRLGVIASTTRRSIDAMPTRPADWMPAPIREVGSGTDIASAIQLALATFSQDAMHRMLLVWDGNQTTGDLEAAVECRRRRRACRSTSCRCEYNVQNEVLVERAHRAGEEARERAVHHRRHPPHHEHEPTSPASSPCCTAVSRWTWTRHRGHAGDAARSR